MPRPASLVIFGLGMVSAAIGVLRSAARWANYQATLEPRVKRAPPRHPMRGR